MVSQLKNKKYSQRQNRRDMWMEFTGSSAEPLIRGEIDPWQQTPDTEQPPMYKDSFRNTSANLGKGEGCAGWVGV